MQRQGSHTGKGYGGKPLITPADLLLMNLGYDVTHQSIVNTTNNNTEINNVHNTEITDIMGMHVLGNKYTHDGMYNTGMQTFKVILL